MDSFIFSLSNWKSILVRYGTINNSIYNNSYGVFVLVVEGAPEGCVADEKSALLSLSPEEHIEHYISEGLSKMDAIKAVAKDRGVPKSEIYKYTI